MYFSLSLHTAEKELGYPLTFMAEKIAEVVTYPAEVCKKKKIAPRASSLVAVQRASCRNHPALMAWSAAPQRLCWQCMGFLGQEGKGEVSPSSPSQGAVGSLLPLTGMGLLCILQEFRMQLRSFQQHILGYRWPKGSMAAKDNSQLCHARGQLGRLSGS